MRCRRSYRRSGGNGNQQRQAIIDNEIVGVSNGLRYQEHGFYQQRSSASVMPILSIDRIAPYRQQRRLSVDNVYSVLAQCRQRDSPSVLNG